MVEDLPEEWTDISIHALREEGDSDKFPLPPPRSLFLSTPSARRATNYRHLSRAGEAISIHALREEGDRHSPFQKLVTQ